MPDIESTAKFKADISSLKKEMQAASRAVKLADAEFKAAVAGMDDWSSSADGLEAKLKQLSSTLQSQKTRYEQQKKVLQNTVAVYGENSAAADRERTALLNMEAAIKRTESQIKNYTSTLEEVKAAAEKAADGTEDYESASDELKNTISEQESKLKELKKRYSDLQLEQGDTADESEQLAKEISDLSGELKDNKNRLSDAEKAADEFDDTLDNVDDAAKDASDGFTVMKGALADLLADGIRKALEGLKDLAKATFEAGSNFESGMSQVAAISGASGDELDALTQKAKEMGETTKFSATESAEAFNYMAMAGWKTEDMIGGIEGIMNLAAASGEDLATTSDIVTDALTAMGYSAKDSGRLADVMAAASSNANTNVAMMGQTFQYAAPILGALGYSMEDAAVAIGLMANAGIKGEKSGTALRSILTRLSAPPKECADAMEELGISLTDSSGNMKDLDDIMQDLRGAFDGLSETEQTSIAKAIAGQEAMSGLLAIVNAAPEDFEKLTQAVENSNGAAEKMSETMLDNLGGDLTLLRSKIEGIQIQIYEKAAPQIRKGIEQISKALDKVDWGKVGDTVGVAFEKLVSVFTWIINHAGAIVSALKSIATVFITYAVVTTVMKVVSAFQTLFTAIQAGTSIVEAFNTVLNLNPIALVIAGIAGLAVAMVELYKHYNDAIEAEYGLTEAQQKTVASASNLKSEYDQMAQARKDSLDGISSEYGYLEDLKDEYNSLIDSNGDVKQGYEDRANFIVTTLAEALGIEQEEVQKIIEENGKLSDSIDDLIRKKQAEASLMALEGDYTKAIQERDNALQTYVEAQELVTQREQDYVDAMAEAGDTLKTYQSILENAPDQAYHYYLANKKVIDGAEIAEQAYDDARQALVDSEEAYVGYVSTIQNYEGLSSAIISGDTEKIQLALTNAQNGFITAQTGTERTLKQQVRTFEEQYRAMERAVAQGMPGVTEEQLAQAQELVERSRQELNKLGNAGKEAGEQLPKSLEEGIKTAAHAVPPAVEELAKNANFKDLEQKALDAGISVPESIVSGIADGSLTLDAAIEQMTSLADFADLLTKSEAAGTAVPDYITQGILDGSLEPQQAIAQMITLANFNTLVEKANEAGIEIPEEITAGVTNGSSGVTTAIAQLISLVNTELGKGSTGAGEAGKNYTIGYSNGILSLIDNATGAAVSIGEASLTALSEEIEEGSPSKATHDSGENFTLGFSEGIGSEEESASEAAKALADKALEELDGLNSKAKKSGETSGKAYSTGVSSGKVDANKSGKTIASAAVQGESSGTKDSTTAGQQSGRNFNAGITTQTSGARSAGATIASQANAGAQSVDSTSSGKNFSQGFINGIGSLVQSAWQTAKNLAKQAWEGLKKGQQEGSPSKLTYQSGKFFTQGYINGIASQQKALVKTVKNLVSSALTEMQKMSGYNFDEVGQNASKLFADSIDKNMSYMLNRIQYQNQYKLADFDNEISKLQSQKTAATNKLQAASDKKQAALQAKYDKESDKTKKAAIKKQIDAEKASVKKQIAASEKNYDQLISTQQKYKEAYQTASQNMLSEFTTAMNSYQQQAQALIDSTINGITEKYNERYNSLLAKQDDLVNKLKSAGDLFEISGAGVITVNDIKAQTKAITDYTNKLQKIKGKVSSELFDQIASYDMAEGSAFMDQLLAMSANDLEAYNKAYTEKMEAAQKAGQKIYKADFNQIAKDYKAEIKTVFAGLPKQLEELGTQAMKGFVNGLTKNTDYMDSNVKTFIKGMVNQFKTQLKIKSPSRVMFGLGEYTGEGFDNGLLSVLKSIQGTARDIAQAVTSPLNGVTGDLSGIRAAVNPYGVGGLYGANGASQVVNNYNLVQNNNSPKALSALDTYQARRQQIALVKAFAH